MKLNYFKDGLKRGTDMIISQIFEGVKKYGIMGALKSSYYSLKHTSSIDSILAHSNSKIVVSGEPEFNINNKISIGASPHPDISSSKLIVSDGASISHTGQNSADIGSGCLLNITGEFSIGDSYIQEESYIICHNKVVVGDGCAISWNVTIMDSDIHQIIVDDDMSNKSAPIEIKDDVWVGHDVSIGKGVTIHEGSVIANDSVVVSDVPPHTLVAGNPAEVVREDVEWEY